MGTRTGRGRRWGAATTVLTLAGALLTPVGATAAAPPPTPGAAAPQRLVTLLSGDQVVLRGRDVVDVRPAQGREHLAFHSLIVNGQRHVYPADALPLLLDGRLDPTLFDVTTLAGQGFTGPPPVLLVQEPGARARRELPAATRVRDLPGLGLTALQPQPGFWAGLTAPALRATQGKLWLNQRRRPTLDVSAAVIGAPEAWRHGGTGAGVTVAVLDSGYDENHPDLAGRVSAARSFLPDSPVRDTNGHGTHVAGTVAGSGAASGGRYRGIAPEAKLAIGKVCQDFCPDDAILEGMQWATDQGARVVNLSLGGGTSDGTDPLSQAVNTLTERTGALFVIAAGNSGQPESVESPGAADAALTVAASTKTGQLAPFSSRGPRRGDGAAKPDLTAPGVDIVAARASGTVPQHAVSETYARLSGTSMATPHVAGAAAVLAQRHPDWKATQLKAALMGTASPLAGVDVPGQGTGRLDLARAHGQGVRAEPASLSLGSHPRDRAEPVRRPVRYHNDTDRPVTLRLDLPAHGGLLTLDRRELTVPAHGSAEVTVTADPRRGNGFTGTRLTATADGVTLRTSAVITVSRPAHLLTVTARSHLGTPEASTTVVAQNLDTGRGQVLFGTTTGLEAGRYRLLGQVIDVEHGPGYPYGVYTDRVKFARDITLDKDTEVTFDGSTAKAIDVRVDDPEAILTPRSLGLTAGLLSQPPGKPAAANTMFVKPGKEFVLPSPPMSELTLYSNTSFNRRLLSATLGATELDPIELDPTDANPLGFRGDLTAKVVDAGSGTPADLAKVDLRGALALMRFGRLPTVDGTTRVAAALAEGAAGVLLDDSHTHYLPGWTAPVAGLTGPGMAALREALAAQPPVSGVPRPRTPAARPSANSGPPPTGPAASASAASAPATGAPATGAPATGAPRSGVPAVGTPAAGLPTAGSLTAGVPTAGALTAGASVAGAPTAGAAGATAAGVPSGGASAAGAPTVRLRGTANTPTAYVLHDRVTGGLPNGVRWHHSARDLGTQRTRVAQPGPGELATELRADAEVAGQWFGASIPVRAPAELDVRYTPGLAWITSAAIGASAYAQYGIHDVPPTTMTAGSTGRQSLFKAPFGPELPQGAVVRDEDKIKVALPLFSQSGGTGVFSGDHDKGSTALSSNGERLGGSDVPGHGTVHVPAQRRPYELRVEGTRAMPGVDLGTWASARWTFHSGRTEREAELPLLDIRYDLPLDLANRAPRGAFTFGVTATRRTGGRAVALALEYSADDGLTWRPALTLPTGGGTWDVRVTNPDSGFVSLRTTALDADGGSATEALTRAYRVG